MDYYKVIPFHLVLEKDCLGEEMSPIMNQSEPVRCTGTAEIMRLTKESTWDGWLLKTLPFSPRN